MANKLSFEIPEELTQKYFEMFVEMNRRAIKHLEKMGGTKKRYLSKKEVCEYLNISYQTLQNMIKNGLPTVLIGSKVFIDIQDVHFYMDKHKF